MTTKPSTVTLEQAYAEACRALGESIVMQRFIAADLERLTADDQPATTPPSE